MEGEKDMSGIQSTVSGPAGYVGGGYGDNGITGALVAAALLNRRDEDKFIESINANSLSDLRHDVSTNTSEIRESIHNSDLHLIERINDGEKESINAKFEARLETKQAVKELSEEMRCVIGRLEGCVQGFQTQVMERFCAQEAREAARENQTLRDRISALEDGNQTATLLKAITEALKK